MPFKTTVAVPVRDPFRDPIDSDPPILRLNKPLTAVGPELAVPFAIKLPVNVVLLVKVTVCVIPALRDALIVKLFQTDIPRESVQLLTFNVDPATVNTPPTLVYNSVLLFPKNTVLNTVKFPVLLMFRLHPNSPAPLHVVEEDPSTVMLVEPPKVLVTVKSPFTFSGPPLSETALAATLEDVNDPATVKLSVMVIVVGRFVTWAMITGVGHGMLFDVMDAVFAVILKFEEPVKVMPAVMVSVPELSCNSFARFSVPAVNVNVVTEHVVPTVIIPVVFTSIAFP